MRANSIRAIHPEYLRSSKEGEHSALEVAWRRYGIFLLALLFILGGGSVWILRSSVMSLQEELKVHRGESQKIFKEYDALHQAIVDKLKRHSEIVKSLEPTSAGKISSSTHGVVTVPRANVRSEPNPESDVLMTLPLHSRLLIEERREEWFKVTTPNGTSGYLSDEVFKEAA